MWGVRVSIRPEQPEPFLRGCVFPAVSDAPYPRADPAGAEYLPADVWDAAQLPVGVRLEMVGEARTIRIWYKTTRASLGYRGESAGCSFVAYRGGQKVAMAEAVMGEGMAEMVISGRPELPVTVYIPEGMQPLITGVAGVEETMVPAPPQPRWLAYGDAVTQGWLASAPAMAWPAVAGRKLGLDVCNLGYTGTATRRDDVGPDDGRDSRRSCLHCLWTEQLEPGPPHDRSHGRGSPVLPLRRPRRSS